MEILAAHVREHAPPPLSNSESGMMLIPRRHFAAHFPNLTVEAIQGGRRFHTWRSLNVLVTGSAGRIGRAVVHELKSRGHFVRGLDLVNTPGADESVVSDLADAPPSAKPRKALTP